MRGLFLLILRRGSVWTGLCVNGAIWMGLRAGLFGFYLRAEGGAVWLYLRAGVLKLVCGRGCLGGPEYTAVTDLSTRLDNSQCP